MKSGGVTVSQLLEGGCLSNSEMALIVHKVGYTLFEVTAADAFTADQLLFAGGFSPAPHVPVLSQSPHKTRADRSRAADIDIEP
jgi:hypothetical protein